MPPHEHMQFGDPSAWGKQSEYERMAEEKLKKLMEEIHARENQHGHGPKDPGRFTPTAQDTANDRETSEILSHLAEMEHFIGDLNKLLYLLQDKLNPVLSPCVVHEKQTQNLGQRTPKSEVINRINELCDSLDGIRQHVSHITERLEV